LLPYLEADNVYKIVNFAVTSNDPTNLAARGTEIKGFLCPADPKEDLPAGFAGNNYVATYGSDIWWASNESRATGAFFFVPTMEGAMPIAGVYDGTSNTAFFSERMRGDWSNAIVTERTDLFNPKGVMPNNADEAVTYCAAINPNNLADQWRSDFGGYWLTGWHMTMYTHASKPNTRACAFPQNGSMNMPASSWHTGGVNLVMGDGSVRFALNTIDINIWRALGTRKGGEVNVDY
jgi:prepilin-type processing-associated H-X9-DG protein